MLPLPTSPSLPTASNLFMGCDSIDADATQAMPGNHERTVPGAQDHQKQGQKGPNGLGELVPRGKNLDQFPQVLFLASSGKIL